MKLTPQLSVFLMVILSIGNIAGCSTIAPTPAATVTTKTPAASTNSTLKPVPSLTPALSVSTISEIYSRSLAYNPFERSDTNDYCEDGSLTIASRTVKEDLSVEDNWQWATNNFSDLSHDTWENFVEINKHPVPVSDDLALGCSYTLLDTRVNPPDWSRENCTTIYYVSQVGFNAQRNQALVDVVSSCGDFGFGTYYFLELIDGHWKITDFTEGMIT